ncbi:response regulator transcription factor [Streptomyces capitiformicae]|uniref:DNA-binding response regulator n=1 Tax=Streptomyces capitiformicae TaxID=2014920 RepID=A0A919GPV2_9ACTN|nr:response regulator transcription factor [Streptomyces capitiformicae]GHH88609.1 DNA-binding response regulator [Streptomyces capitiformicae]
MSMSGRAEVVVRPSPVLRIAVIGDCPLFRHGVSQLIGTAPDLHLVAAAASIEAADGSLRGAEVVLMDLQQSAPRLAAAVAKLRRQGHAVIVVSSSPRVDAVQVIREGASGYLSRQAEGEEVLTAIRAVGSGRSYVCAPAGQLLGPSPRFTDREQEILRLVADGATDHEIAARLRISKHTVQSHLDRIGEKTGSRRRSDLTRLAVESGLTDAEQPE